MKQEPNYSRDYPTAWKEGYMRGRKGFKDGFNLDKISPKGRFKEFWQKMAFQNGIIDGWQTEQEAFNVDIEL